jgi:hypothetical protein
MTIPKSPSIPLYERGRKKKSSPLVKGESEGFVIFFRSIKVIIFSYKNRAVRIRKGNLYEAGFIMENMYSVHKINPVGVG